MNWIGRIRNYKKLQKQYNQLKADYNFVTISTSMEQVRINGHSKESLLMVEKICQAQRKFWTDLLKDQIKSLVKGNNQKQLKQFLK